MAWGFKAWRKRARRLSKKMPKDGDRRTGRQACALVIAGRRADADSDEHRSAHGRDERSGKLTMTPRVWAHGRVTGLLFTQEPDLHPEMMEMT
ncbi:hypothetical protein CRG98_001202 [Punica granatum]|uniref:Uncharacterized protein n=1 Tax=Punica granatum TaxID=22663 RepID=A0A2I0LCI1_PUNGR|nr:hypothetical protein CRG98_001202 [Punica granatum]